MSNADYVDYYRNRSANRYLSYRLWRRTREVESAIRRHYGHRIGLIVDVGSADRLMTRHLGTEFPNSKPLGNRSQRGIAWPG